jgi:hypothetical protein
MEKQNIEVVLAKKAEGTLDPAKKGTDAAAPPAEEEVGGRFVGLYVRCPYCHSIRYVRLDHEGEWFDCGNCGSTYQVWA